MRSIKLLLFLSILIVTANIGRAETTPPDFSVFTTHNDSFHLHDDYLEEGKVVLIEFFFTTCPPCMDIAPYMEGLYQDWGGGEDNVEFILITNKSFDDNSDVAQYADNYGFTFPGVGVDGGAIGVWNLYKDSPWGSLFGTPAYIVIAPDGSVQYDVSGPTVQATIDSLDVALERAVNTNPAPPAKSFNRILSTHYKSGDTIQDVEALFYNYPESGDTSVGMPIQNGQFTDFLPDSVSSSADFSIEMYKNDPANIDEGISAFDILLIQMHVLEFIELGFFESKAGDINRDGKLSGGDLISIRRVILGLVNDFGQWPTWRFFPDYMPENQLDSLEYDEYWDFPDEWDYAPVEETEESISFKAVKTGDVNGSWSSSFRSEKDVEVRNGSKVQLLKKYDEKTGTYSFFVQNVHEETYSFQFDLKFEKGEEVQISSTLPGSNFFAGQVDPTTIRLGFYDVNGAYFNEDQALFQLSVLNNSHSDFYITASEWYTNLESPRQVQLVEVEEHTTLTTIMLYPNPFTNNINLYAPTTKSIVLQDAQGRQIRELQLNEGYQQIELGDLPSGQYYLMDTSSNWVKAILKQ